MLQGLQIHPLGRDPLLSISCPSYRRLHEGCCRTGSGTLLLSPETFARRWGRPGCGLEGETRVEDGARKGRDEGTINGGEQQDEDRGRENSPGWFCVGGGIPAHTIQDKRTEDAEGMSARCSRTATSSHGEENQEGPPGLSPLSLACGRTREPFTQREKSIPSQTVRDLLHLHYSRGSDDTSP